MQKLKEKIMLFSKIGCIVLAMAIVITACSDEGNGSTKGNDELLEKKLYQTWVLIEKNINNIQEKCPENDMYPVTLTFCSTQKFRGRHDANSYGGTSIINKNNISFIIDSITDCMDIPWFFDYVFFELKQIDQAFIFSQNNDTTNMQLKLSNQENSIILFFINKKWFEETYFKLEEWYD